MAEMNIEKMGQNVARKAIQELRDNGVFIGRWIPLKTRPMTDEESAYYMDWVGCEVEMIDCPLPDDGQEVLVSCGGNVFVDVFVNDSDCDGCYFEGVDIDDVEAWMPLPEPYGTQESEDKE